MMLLLLRAEADCLDRQHGRTVGAAKKRSTDPERATANTKGTSHLPVTVSKHQD
jgi:hypothetical protein